MSERPVTFGATNIIPVSTISSAGAVDEDNLRNTFKARRLSFVNRPFEHTFIIIATPAQTRVRYVSALGLNIHPSAQIRARVRDLDNQIYVPSSYEYVHDLAGLDAPADVLSADNIDLDVAHFDYYDNTLVTDEITLDILYDVSDFGTGYSANFSLQTVVAGDTLTLQKTLSYASVVENHDPPDLIQSSLGTWYRRTPSRRRRALRLRLDQMSDNDRFAFNEMRRNLNGQPFMIDCFPDRPRSLRNEFNFFCRIAEEPSIGMVYDDIHSTSLLLVEA